MNRGLLQPDARRCALLLAALAAVAAPSPRAAAGATVVAHTRYDGRYWQVWVCEPDGRNERRLTDSPWDKRTLRAIAAPPRLFCRDNQGKLFALDPAGAAAPRELLPKLDVVKDYDFDPAHGFLVSSYAPNSLDNVVVWHCAEDGAGLRLANPDPYLNEMPRWLGGSTRFVFVKSHGPRSVLCVSDLEKPKVRELTPNLNDPVADPCPSPDGQWVAFCREREKNMDLWLVRADGTGPRALHRGAGLEAEPGWSPDGDWVFFSTSDGGRFRIARIRPDGSSFAYVSPSGVDARCPVALTL
jgi:dipeptidyl aminopeptidase/acylaminoacyl peptidase